MAKAPVPTPVNGDSKPAEGTETGTAAAAAAVVAEPGTEAEIVIAEPGAGDEAVKQGEQLNQDEAAADVEVRVLHDHLDYRANDVATLSARDAAVAVKAGWADADPDAVAYAKSQAPAPAREDA